MGEGHSFDWFTAPFVGSDPDIAFGKDTIRNVVRGAAMELIG